VPRNETHSKVDTFLIRQEMRLQCRSSEGEWSIVNPVLVVSNNVFFGGEAALSSSRLGWMTTSSLVWLGAAETCLQMIQYYAVDCNWLRLLQASTHVNPGLCSTRHYERVRETLILCAAVSLERLPTNMAVAHCGCSGLSFSISSVHDCGSWLLSTRCWDPVFCLFTG
jgi:hypothetical protein